MFTLHNGDCLQVMPTIPSGSIDAIITDLPYGTTACKWDTIIPFEPMWKEVKRVLKPNGAFITTASQPFTSALIMSNPSMFKYRWVYEKSNAVNFANAKKQPLRKVEDIVVFYKGQSVFNPQFTEGKPYKMKEGNRTKGDYMNSGKEQKVGSRTNIVSYYKTAIDNTGYRYPVDILYFKSERKNHPTQKPVALYEYLIRTYTNEGETVLDIAMGSGTTIEAAERTGRNSIGIEKDEGIFQTAVLRLKSLTPSNNRLHPDVGNRPAQKDLFTLEAGSAAGKSPKPAPRR